MNLGRSEFRAMIYYDFKCKLSAEESFERLTVALGSEAPSKPSIYRWFREFKFGRTTLKDGIRTGRPKTAVVQRNIDAVGEVITADRHATCREIAHQVGISMTSVHKILHQHLNVRKLCARWIPHLLTDAQKQNRVDWCKAMIAKYDSGASKAVYNIVTGDESWIYEYDPETKNQSTVWVFQDEPPPTKVARSRSVGKQMVACFFSITGHVATVPLVEQRTVTANWYVIIGFPAAFEEVRKTNPRRRIILHHDNASAPTAHQTLAYLKNENVELMTHPSYSPDLAPNEFILFPKIKKKLRGQRFPSPEAAVEALKNHVSDLPSLEFNKCYKKWFERMDKCISCKGEYFEKI